MTAEFSKELQGYLEELKGMSAELHGVPEQYKELKAKAEETEQKLAELGQSVDIALKRTNLGGGSIEDVMNAPDMKAFSQYLKKGVAQELNGPSGGYLVAPTLVGRIVELQKDLDVIRQYANVISVGTNLAQIPVETAMPSTSWVGEIETRGDTNGVALGLGNIPVNTVQATVKISRDLVQDAAIVNFENYILQNLSWALADAEGAAFVNGTGFKQPEGLFACPNITKEVKSGTSATAPGPDEMIEMWEETTQATDVNAAYYVSKALAVHMRKFKATGSGDYLWNPALSQGMDPTFNGFPVRILKSAPNTITTNDTIVAMFGDLRNAYTIVDRMDMDILRDEVTCASNNQIKYIVNKRVGGGVVQPDSMVKMVIGA